MTRIIVGIGQDRGGDDAVGLAVARELAAHGLEARETADASILLALLAEGRSVVVVDAVVGGGAPGSVIHVAAGAVAGDVTPISSHGLGVTETLDVARALYGQIAVDLVAVVIEPPLLGSGLSPAVAAAIAPAAALARSLSRK